VQPVAPIAPLRRVRGAAFAAVALGLGLAAHRAGGGRLPDPGVIVVLAVPVLWASLFLARAWRGWPVVVTTLLAVEAGLHHGLSYLSGPAGPMPTASPGRMVMAGHTMVTTGTAARPVRDGMSGMALGPSAAMIVAHLGATVLTGLVLAYGEHLVRSLWTWLHHAVTVFAPAPVVGPRPALPTWWRSLDPVPAPVNRNVRRRGPPPSLVLA